jgi:hypothetical protein
MSDTQGDDKKKRSSAEILAAIDAIADDVLDPDYPKELLDEELREAGGDPEAIGKRGADLAAKLLVARREALRGEMIANVQPLADRLHAARAKPAPSRQEMRDRIRRAEADPRYAGQIAVAARGRRPDEPTDEELAALYATLVALGIVAEDG